MATWERRLGDLARDRGADLLRYGFLLSGDASEAADLVQDALVRVFVRPEGGRDIDHLEGYVRRAMLTGYLDRTRRRARWRAVRHLLVRPSHQDDDGDRVVGRQSLRAALGHLSPRQRACLVLRYYEDLPLSQIAHDLGCSEGSVKRHLSDALRRLAPHLEPEAHRGEYS